MRNILIQTSNDRGNEERLSTRKKEMNLTVFFNSGGAIRKENLIFKLTSDGSLRVENDNGLLLQTEGDKGAKLPYSK